MPESNNFGFIGEISEQGGDEGNNGVFDVSEIDYLQQRGKWSKKEFQVEYLVIAGEVEVEMEIFTDLVVELVDIEIHIPTSPLVQTQFQKHHSL